MICALLYVIRHNKTRRNGPRGGEGDRGALQAGDQPKCGVEDWGCAGLAGQRGEGDGVPSLKKSSGLRQQRWQTW